MTKTYYPSKHAIRQEHHVDGRTLTKWMRRPDWPKFAKGKGWPMDAVDSIVVKLREEQATAVTGANADLRREKLLNEVAYIREGIRLRKLEADQKDKLLIPMEKHIEDMRTFAGWTKDVLAQWISEVKVITGDAKVCAEAERLRDRCYARMKERIERDKSQSKKGTT